MAKRTQVVEKVKATTAPPSTGTELAPVRAEPRQTAFMDKEEWGTAMEQAAVLIQSGMLPGHIKTAAQFLAVVVRGRELGLAPMEAVSHLYIVQGKVSLDVQTQLGIVLRRLPGAKVDIAESTDKLARVLASRPGTQPKEFTFSWQEAIQANLSKKAIWSQYPKIMLLWRAIGQACRTQFPDVLAGVYAPGELPQDNRVIEIEGRVVSSQPSDGFETAPWAQDPPATPPPTPKTIERVNEETGEITEEPAPSAAPSTGKTTKARLF